MQRLARVKPAKMSLFRFFTLYSLHQESGGNMTLRIETTAGTGCFPRHWILFSRGQSTVFLNELFRLDSRPGGSGTFSTQSHLLSEATGVWSVWENWESCTFSVSAKDWSVWENPLVFDPSDDGSMVLGRVGANCEDCVSPSLATAIILFLFSQNKLLRPQSELKALDRAEVCSKHTFSYLKGFISFLTWKINFVTEIYSKESA